MRVEKNGKTLWHIQNMNICSDGTPYDMFLWSENEPTKEELRKAFAEDYGEDSYTIRQTEDGGISVE